MTLHVFDDPRELAATAAAQAAELIGQAIAEHGAARVTFSTGVSQLAFLQHLTATPNINWQHVELFHLDEYIGMRGDHPASFQRFIRERIVEPTGLKKAHLIDGMADPVQVCRDTGMAISKAPIDLEIVGIGENGHLAFNDPPADFITEEPFIIVSLDEQCQLQQVGEGWFASIAEVPKQAITMSIRQILKARAIICIAPEARKAEAVRRCFTGDISPLAPASVLRSHSNVTVYLDQASARLLEPGVPLA